jgi:hypothetical protein
MRWRNGLLTASSALLLAGCGGGNSAPAPPPHPPKIPAAVAARLAAQADRVAVLAPGSCAARDAAARFRSEVVASVGRIPARFQRPLVSAAHDLAGRLAACTPPPPPVEPVPQEEHGKHRGHEHGHGHGHGKKHGEDEQ